MCLVQFKSSDHERYPLGAGYPTRPVGFDFYYCTIFSTTIMAFLNIWYETYDLYPTFLHENKS